jgi:3-hydroxyacyl-[acyl-carrier-protein] dehydratase
MAHEKLIDIKGIMEMLPHRYPFLLIDRIVKVVPGESVTAIKNVTFNEPFFQGHFPKQPVMPGVLIVEAMAQAGIVLVGKTVANVAGQAMYLMSIEKAHFRRMIEPGDQMEIEVVKIFGRHNAWKLKGEVKVDGLLVADASFSAIFPQK